MFDSTVLWYASSMIRYVQFVILVTVILTAGFFSSGPKPPTVSVILPTPEILLQQLASEAKQRQYDAAENIAAKIMRSHCHTDEYAELVARAAVDLHVSVRALTGLIVVESTCRPDVISSEGAVGLMQVVPRKHNVSRAQLLDPEFNVRTGTQILAQWQRESGLREALHRYNGLGVGCATCDARYPDKVLLVAGLAH